MAIAVQADRARRDGLEGIAADRECLLGQPAPAIRDVVGNQVPCEQEVAARLAVAGDVEGDAVLERRDRADGVQPADEAAEPAPHFSVLELGSATGAALADAEAVDRARLGAQSRQRRAGARDGVDVRRARVERERDRRRHGNLALHQLGGEGVLLEDLRIAPATGAIELGDDDPAAFEEDLEDAVLVRVQLDQPAVALQADGVERVEDATRREVGVRGRAGGGFGGISAHGSSPATAGAGG